MWLWEGYFNPGIREKWFSASEKLRKINPHVIQDIEDYILLHGLKDPKVKDVKVIIDRDLYSKRMQKKNREKEEEDKEKLHDKNRNFLNQMRPPFCWNFFEDQEEKTPHILRHNADPRESYIDGRIEDLMEDISSIGYNLSHQEPEKWSTLRKFTVEIFKN
jgi:hypothetical protein